MKMNVIMVSVFLPLLLLLAVMNPVTSRLNSVRVTSYKALRKTKKGPELCALDQPNQTTTSSSLEHCSLNCARHVTCTAFNIKNALTCDEYNYKPKFTVLVPGCKFMQVCYHFRLSDLNWHHVLGRSSYRPHYASCPSLCSSGG